VLAYALDEPGTRTAESHVGNILTKLGFTNGAQVAAGSAS
jgi:DNA-binding NarL/FixJ family response regulator